MDYEIVDCALPIEQIPGVFREAIERRPARAKMNRVESFTPDIGPYLGFGGIVDPDYAIAAEVQPLNSANSQAGGTIIMLAESHGNGSRVAVITDRWSRFSFSTGLRATRDGLIDRLRSASSSDRADASGGRRPAPPPSRPMAVDADGIDLVPGERRHIASLGPHGLFAERMPNRREEMPDGSIRPVSGGYRSVLIEADGYEKSWGEYNSYEALLQSVATSGALPGWINEDLALFMTDYNEVVAPTTTPVRTVSTGDRFEPCENCGFGVDPMASVCSSCNWPRSPEQEPPVVPPIEHNPRHAVEPCDNCDFDFAAGIDECPNCFARRSDA